MRIQTIFSKNLKKYRKKAKLTQEKLAELCESDYRYIGQIETGNRSPSLEFVGKIASALSIPPFFLFVDKTDNLLSIFSSEEMAHLYQLNAFNIEQAVNDAVDKAFSKHYTPDQKDKE